MKKFVFAIAVAVTSLFLSALSPSAAFAQVEGSASEMGGMMINQGNVEVGGGGNFLRQNQGDRWDLNINGKVEYFFLNRFSGGGRVEFSDSNVDSTYVRVGPSATYYFAIIKNIALYVDQAILWTNPRGDGDNYIYGDTGIGADFFVRPNIAVGPSVRGVYYFNGDRGLPSGGTDIRINLSTFF
jgi:hypothetical protein